MQSQTTNSRAKMLGPFLTLILVVDEAGQSRAYALPGSSREGSTSHYRPFATSDETLHATEPAFRTPLMLGPFLTLILTLRRRRRENLMALAVRI